MTRISARNKLINVRVAARNELINVRMETLRDRPIFRDDLVSRRCLVLADGFYEWKADAERRHKVPYRITREDAAPFAFAGIWEEGSDGISPRFAIITTAADDFMRPIHSRMPVILDRSEERAWISDRTARTCLLGLLESPYASPLRAYEVSREVNRAAVDLPSLIEPVSPGEEDQKPLFRAAKV